MNHRMIKTSGPDLGGQKIRSQKVRGFLPSPFSIPRSEKTQRKATQRCEGPGVRQLPAEWSAEGGGVCSEGALEKPPAAGQLPEAKRHSATQTAGDGRRMGSGLASTSAFSGGHPLRVGPAAASPELGSSITDMTLTTPYSEL